MTDAAGPKIVYEEGLVRDCALSVIPGEDNAKSFKFYAKLPKLKPRAYSLIIYGVSFSGGGLSFEDMNGGEWEFSLDGGEWTSLILQGGQLVIQKNVVAGEKIISIRAKRGLNINASGGRLGFSLKLERTK